MLIKDFNDRFGDLKAMNFPSWLTQPLLVDVSDAAVQYQEELSELKHDESVITLFKLKGTNMWLCDEVVKKYPNIIIIIIMVIFKCYFSGELIALS